jgi:DNA-binding response OmpR family regulator
MTVRRKLLLVDDEPSILLAMKAILEMGGFAVDTAATAGEAKRRLKRTAYEMVITDMRMETDGCGAEVARAARVAANRPAIALLSADAMDAEEQELHGAAQVLVKPVETRTLLRQIEALLVRHADEMAMRATLTKAKRRPAAKKVVKKSAAKKKAAPKRKVAAKKTSKKKKR